MFIFYHNHVFQVLCVGPTGTGKTLTTSDKLLKGMNNNYLSHFITFSARTSANQTQDIIDAKLDKRYGVNREIDTYRWGHINFGYYFSLFQYIYSGTSLQGTSWVLCPCTEAVTLVQWNLSTRDKLGPLSLYRGCYPGTVEPLYKGQVGSFVLVQRLLPWYSGTSLQGTSWVLCPCTEAVTLVQWNLSTRDKLGPLSLYRGCYPGTVEPLYKGQVGSFVLVQRLLPWYSGTSLQGTSWVLCPCTEAVTLVQWNLSTRDKLGPLSLYRGCYPGTVEPLYKGQVGSFVLVKRLLPWYNGTSLQGTSWVLCPCKEAVTLVQWNLSTRDKLGSFFLVERLLVTLVQ